MARAKSKLISEIFEIIGGDQSRHFDSLSDKSAEYLEKYLRVVKSLKK